MVMGWLFRSGYSMPSWSMQVRYLGVTLFCRPAVAMTLCWLIPLIFLIGLPVSQHSGEQPSHDKQEATKLALCPWSSFPTLLLYFSPTSSSSLSLIPFFDFLTLPPKALRVLADHRGFCFCPPLFCFCSPWCVLSLCPPLWAIYVKAGSSLVPPGWWIESWLSDRQQKITIHISPKQNTLICKGVIMMRVRVLRTNCSKMSLSTSHLDD